MNDAPSGTRTDVRPPARTPLDAGREPGARADINGSTAEGDEIFTPTGVPRPGLRRFALPLAAAAGVLALIALAVYLWANAGLVKTDNAQTAGDLAPISSRVPGTVVKLRVDENQHVAQGDVLVELDQQDYRLAVSRAQANLTAAQAQVRAAEAALSSQEQLLTTSIHVAQAGVQAAQPRLPQAQAQLEIDERTTAARLAEARARVTTAEAGVVAARAALDTSTRNVARDRELLAQGAIAQQQLDADASGWETLHAQHQAAQDALAQARAELAAVEAARQQVTISRHAVDVNRGEIARSEALLQQAAAGSALVRQRAGELAMAQARVAEAAEALRTAQLDLSRTLIRAPADGWVTNRTAQLGQVIQPNQPLMSLTLTQRVWVVANIKETQLGRIRVGDPVRVTVDAYRGRVFKGRVASIGSTTGSTTALLPPDNATGNFVKVVQLVPVRIALTAASDPGLRRELPHDGGQAGRPDDPQLAVGLSAEVAIDTRHRSGR